KFKLNGEEVLFDLGVLGWYEEYMDRGNVVYRFYFNNYPQQGDSGEKLNLDLYSKTPLKTNKKYKSADSADYEDWVASGQFDIFEDLRLYYEGPQFMKYLYITSSVEDSEAATVEFTEITDNYL